MPNETDIRGLLKAHFQKAKAKNPRYSLRAMANRFDTSPAQLSQVLSGKRPLSYKFADKVARKLDLAPRERAEILGTLKNGEAAAVQFDLIRDDSFSLVADWYHFGILSLSKLPDNSADIRWIARRLNLDYFTAKEAYERLLRLGLIRERGGKFTQATRPLHTTTDVPSEAIRRHHKQNLEIAAGKLDAVDVSLREFSSVTLAVNLARLPLAKRMIQKFKSELFELLESGEKQEVYTLSIQLFPITEINSRRKVP